MNSVGVSFNIGGGEGRKRKKSYDKADISYRYPQKNQPYLPPHINTWKIHALGLCAGEEGTVRNDSIPFNEAARGVSVVTGNAA